MVLYLSVTTKALKRPVLNQICHSSAGSEDIEDGFLAVKWFLDGELLKEIALAPQCQDRSNDDPKCNVDPSKIILVRRKPDSKRLNCGVKKQLPTMP